MGTPDVEKGKSILILSFPRMKFFYLHKGVEVELRPNERVNADDGESYVDILARMELRSKSYTCGERLTLTSADFGEVAMACHFLGGDIAQKLPTML